MPEMSEDSLMWKNEAVRCAGQLAEATKLREHNDDLNNAEIRRLTEANAELTRQLAEAKRDAGGFALRSETPVAPLPTPDPAEDTKRLDWLCNLNELMRKGESLDASGWNDKLNSLPLRAAIDAARAGEVKP